MHGMLYVFWFFCHVFHNFPFWGKTCIYLLISGICEICMECFMFFDFFVMCWIFFHFEAKRVYIWLHLESVKYAWNALCFLIFCHVLHNFPFWGKTCIYLIISGICEIFMECFMFFALFVTSVLHLLPRLHREVCRCQGHQTLRRRGLRRLWRFRGTARAVTAYDGQKDGDGPWAGKVTWRISPSPEFRWPHKITITYQN